MKVLIAEDDPGILELVSTFLTSEGFSIETATNGREALEKIGEIDVLLTDWNMPDMDGIELTYAIEKKGLFIFIIFMTAYGEKDDVIKALAIGANDYITKPFDLLDLKFRIEQAQQFLSLNRALQAPIQ